MSTATNVCDLHEVEVESTPELDGILNPVSAQEFLSNYFGKSFLHVPGETGKFSQYFSWTEVNRILRHHGLKYPQLRVVKEGKVVPAEQIYCHDALSARGLADQLNNGASLVIDRIEELCEPVTNLAESLADLFQTRVNVNMYAGWKQTNAFDVHWDDHDVIVLQIAGQKDWKIYGETQKHPVERTWNNSLKPLEPVWESTLRDGDSLYIPRGCWHVAIPCNEPTLHLTIGIYNPTGFDLLRWVISRLSDDECMRMDLPRFASPELLAEHVSLLQSAITRAMENPELMEQYFEHKKTTIRKRPVFELPLTSAATERNA